MAPALSTEGSASLPDTEWSGEGVTIAEVLEALTGIRQRLAHVEAGDEAHPHPRNWVMTLVAIGANEEEERRAQSVSRTIAAHHPSMAVVVRDQPNIRAGRINASISTSNLPVPVAGKPELVPAPAVRFELVTLHVHGAAGEHLAGLIDPLLPSDVPTYLWWLGTPPFGSKDLRDALPICDALVIDSSRFERPFDSFIGLSELALSSHRKLGLADIQWARLAPWRETMAQFFAPMDRRPFLKGMYEFGIEYTGQGRGNRIAAALLIGWFASALGWKLKRAVAGRGGVVSALFEAEGWRTVEVVFRSVQKAHLVPGEVGAVRIAGTSGGTMFKLSIQRDPERSRRPAPEAGTPAGFQPVHQAGGQDEAAIEIAQRNAIKHREMMLENREALHHTATGDPPGESVPPTPTVFVDERRHRQATALLLTMIEIGGAAPLRHVQRVNTEDEATLLLELLATGAHDPVYARSLAAAAELMHAL